MCRRDGGQIFPKLHSDVTDWRDSLSPMCVSAVRPTIGGKYCLGERKRFRSCNIDVSTNRLQLRRHPVELDSHRLVNIVPVRLSGGFSPQWEIWVADVCGCASSCPWCVCVCVPDFTGVPRRLSRFPGDPVLGFRQRSFPRQVLHLEALQGR